MTGGDMRGEKAEPNRLELIERIGPIITDLARELNDDNPSGTITRVVNILLAHRIPPEHAPNLIYQARTTIKQRHHIRRKAPYLIAVLERLAADWQPPQPPPRQPGAPPGNQNARRHGWWSRLQPLSDQELDSTVKRLLQAEDHKALRELARAVRYVRNDRILAQNIRRLARYAERRTVLRASGMLRRTRAALGEHATEFLGDDWEEDAT
jgi:hypothetical protein